MNDSDYFLSQDFVDRFAHEVKGKKGSKRVDSDDDIESEEGELSAEGDPTDGMEPEVTAEASGPSNSQERALRKNLDACVKNWKSASDDDSKRMWAIFDESGVFMSACRHGLILWIIDMIRSGEL